MLKLLGGVIVVGIIIISMVLHELAHGWVAYKLGDDTAKEDGRLTLNPLKHLDPFMSVILPVLLYLSGGVVFGGAKPVPVNFSRVKGGVWGMALVALAGPMTNFLLAFGGFLVGYYMGVLDGAAGAIGQLIGVEFIIVNLGFMVFNLLPLPPLDGSRVIYAVMPDGVRSMMDSLEKVGLVFVYILIVLGGRVFTVLMSGAITGILNGFYWIVGA
ncbi:site-2 protease family protein [Candidatus Saccharibacteria bacterium]|nr:site-2 protease family protein [Candidatus Saccharibacteria bacterium]